VVVAAMFLDRISIDPMLAGIGLGFLTRVHE
jgi:hypothetical protein